MKTIICDIDGVIFEHRGSLSTQIRGEGGFTLLPGVQEKFNEWDRKGYKIILLTGRRESARGITETQLRNAGLFWDTLIMGAGRLERVIINDYKFTKEQAVAKRLEDPNWVPEKMTGEVPLFRNEGLLEVNI